MLNKGPLNVTFVWNFIVVLSLKIFPILEDSIKMSKTEKKTGNVKYFTNTMLHISVLMVLHFKYFH